MYSTLITNFYFIALAELEPRKCAINIYNTNIYLQLCGVFLLVIIALLKLYCNYINYNSILINSCRCIKIYIQKNSLRRCFARQCFALRIYRRKIPRQSYLHLMLQSSNHILYVRVQNLQLD